MDFSFAGVLDSINDLLLSIHRTDALVYSVVGFLLFALASFLLFHSIPSWIRRSTSGSPSQDHVAIVAINSVHVVSLSNESTLSSLLADAKFGSEVRLFDPFRDDFVDSVERLRECSIVVAVPQVVPLVHIQGRSSNSEESLFARLISQAAQKTPNEVESLPDGVPSVAAPREIDDVERILLAEEPPGRVRAPSAQVNSTVEQTWIDQISGGEFETDDSDSFSSEDEPDAALRFHEMLLDGNSSPTDD